MTDASRPFLRAICERPDDDLPRLVFADWLDEHGEPERAEFVRVQCEIQRRLPENGGSGDAWKLEALRSRERELLAKHIGPWTDGLPEELVTRQCPRCEDQSADWETNVVECRQCDSTGLVPDCDHMAFSRGFISEITLSWEHFARHHAAVLESCPLRDAKDGLVRLMTWPEVEYGGQSHHGRRHRFAGRDRWHTTFDENAIDGIPAMLAAEWPGVRFELPAAGQANDFPSLGHALRAAPDYPRMGLRQVDGRWSYVRS